MTKEVDPEKCGQKGEPKRLATSLDIGEFREVRPESSARERLAREACQRSVAVEVSPEK